MSNENFSVNDAVEKILNDLGIPSNFLGSLLADDDDWSFVMRLHALIEAATTHAITNYLGDHRLAAPVGYLELSNKRSGKLAILSALDLVPSEIRAFINALSELRNELIHKVQNVTFSFANDHSGKLAKIVSQLGDSCQRSGLSQTTQQTSRGVLFEHSPKFAIFLQAEWTIALLFFVCEKGRLRQDVLKLAEKLFGTPLDCV